MKHIARERSRRDPDCPRAAVGGDASPNREVVRFRALPSHSFPPGPIHAVQPPGGQTAGEAADLPAEMVVAFMGLTGPSGVLPQHYTQMVIDRTRRKDYALRDFLDLFNHRIIAHFYRAWEKYRFAITFEDAALDRPESEDLFTRCLYCLVGLGTGGLRHRQAVRDDTFLYFGGFFAHFPRSAVSLECMVQDYLQLPVAVRQFQGQWLHLTENDQTQLPSSASPEGRNNRLGVDALVGQRVWGVENKFRLRIGPLTYHHFRRFTPGGDWLERLCQLVRSYVGPEFDFDVQPVLKAAEVPWCQLGGDGAELGWNTWIRSRPLPADADDAVFFSEGMPKWPRST